MTNRNNQSSTAVPVFSVLTQYGAALFSQGLVSGFHFSLNLVLVRSLSTEDFGSYALVFVMALFLSAIVGALASTPLCVYAPGSSLLKDKKMYEATFNTFAIYLLLMFFCIGILCLYAFTPDKSFAPSIVNMLFVLFFGARQYSRALGFSVFDIKSVLYGDVFYVISSCIFILFATQYLKTNSATIILGCLTIGNILAIICEVRRFQIDKKLQSLSELIRNYRAIWKQSRWALVGAVTTIVVSYAHSPIVSLLKGPAAFAPLAAGFLIFGPVHVVLSTIKNIIRPRIASSLSLHNLRRVKRQIVFASFSAGMIVVILSVIVFVWWPQIYSWAFKAKYTNASMGFIVSAWALVALIRSVSIGPSVALQSMKEFRALALSSTIGACITVVLVFYYTLRISTEYSVYGIIVGELLVSIFLMYLCFTRLGSHDE